MKQVDPWDIQPELERIEDSKTLYILYCEDEVSEPIYFRSFINDKVFVSAIENQKSKRKNLINTISDCENEGRVIFLENKYKTIEGLQDRIWCVYDRDVESENWEDANVADHLEFTTAITTAVDIGFNVAWSNDAFELWILLHFEDIDSNVPVHRKHIYNRLTQIFKDLDTENSYSSNPHFYYKDYFKKRDRFINYVLPHLKDETKRTAAIERATGLHANFEAKGLPYHHRNPCTKVYDLVELLLSH